MLVDYGEACPGSGGAEERWGYEVIEGPKEALFRDDRTQSMGDVNGTLCCYRAKLDHCSSPRVY